MAKFDGGGGGGGGISTTLRRGVFQFTILTSKQGAWSVYRHAL